MLNVTARMNPAGDATLRQLIAPLAGYISAADRPGAALQFAVVALVRSMRQANRAANNQIGSLARRRLPLSA